MHGCWLIKIGLQAFDVERSITADASTVVIGRDHCITCTFIIRISYLTNHREGSKFPFRRYNFMHEYMQGIAIMKRNAKDSLIVIKYSLTVLSYP